MNDNDYSDIIDLPHHVSKRHRPMAPAMRAAQFAPFAALTGFDNAISDAARKVQDDVRYDDLSDNNQ